jgi:hypothetical protein
MYKRGLDRTLFLTVVAKRSETMWKLYHKSFIVQLNASVLQVILFMDMQQYALYILTALYILLFLSLSLQCNLYVDNNLRELDYIEVKDKLKSFHVWEPIWKFKYYREEMFSSRCARRVFRSPHKMHVFFNS